MGPAGPLPVSHTEVQRAESCPLWCPRHWPGSRTMCMHRAGRPFSKNVPPPTHAWWQEVKPAVATGFWFRANIVLKWFWNVPCAFVFLCVCFGSCCVDSGCQPASTEGSRVARQPLGAPTPAPHIWLWFMSRAVHPP